MKKSKDDDEVDEGGVEEVEEFVKKEGSRNYKKGFDENALAGRRASRK
jgi:hypothetical protein